MEQIKGFCKDKYLFIIVFIWAFVASFIGNIFVLFATEVVLFAFALVCGARLQFDIGDVLLGLGMFFFYYFDGRSVVMSVVLAGEVLIVYQMGKILTSFRVGIKDKTITGTIFVLDYTYYIYGCCVFINHFFDLNIGYLDWNAVPRTQHCFWFVLSSALLSVFICCSDVKTSSRIIGLTTGLVGLIATLCVRGRSCMLIFGITLVFLVCLKRLNRIRIKRVLEVGFGCLVLFFIIYNYIIRMNLEGLEKIYKQSVWAKDGGIINNVRIDMWKEGLRLLIKYPFGGNHVEDVSGYWWTFHYAHNSWIDIGVTSGVIPFVLIVLFSIIIMIMVTKTYKREKTYEIYVIISAYIGIFLFNMVEPAIIANRTFWFSLILLSGMLAGLYKKTIDMTGDSIYAK